MSRLARVIGALAALLAALAAFPPEVAAQDLSVFVDNVDSGQFPAVTAHLTVIDDKGMPVLNVPPEAVSITEDGLPVSKLHLSPLVATQEPVAVTLVIDVSQSMAGKPLESARNAASSFIDEIGANDTAAIIAFDGQLSTVSSFTSDKVSLKNALGSLVVGPNTALFDAVVGSIEATRQAPTDHRVIILLTDGQDTNSKQSRESALKAAATARIPIYTIGLGSSLDRQVLEQIASTTGGRSLYAPSSEDLQSAYKGLASQLKSRYVVTFNSQLQADNREHAMLVSVGYQNKKAETTSRFLAKARPPHITFVNPKETTLTGKMTAIEVKVEAITAVARVQFSIDGEVVSEAEREPFRFVWYREASDVGSHLIEVTATDAAGNSSTQRMPVSVVAQSTPEPTFTPPPTPVPLPVPTTESAPIWMSLVPVPAAASALLGLALVASRHRGTQASKSRSPRGAFLTLSGPVCPVCGKRHLLKRTRRSCQEREHQIVQERLQQILRDRSDRHSS